MTISLFLTLLLSLLLTGLIYHLRFKKNILDIPNNRSLHKNPTPRGGGLAIVLSFSISLAILAFFHIVPSHITCAILAGGSIVALVGYIDDLTPVAASWRLSIHLCAALMALTQIEGFEHIHIGNWSLHVGWVGTALAVLGVAWMTNLYNFMDGVDGLAGMQGVFTALAAGIALWVTGHHPNAWVCFFLAAAIAGFLVWNWPPAKIFMGDVGSTWLGFTFAIIMWFTIKSHELPLIFWVIIFSLFFTDTAFTLIKRIIKREKWYQAHSSHAYQAWFHRGYSHLSITLSALCLNVVVFVPIACVILVKPALAMPLLFLSLLGCFYLWMKSTKTIG